MSKSRFLTAIVMVLLLIMSVNLTGVTFSIAQTNIRGAAEVQATNSDPSYDNNKAVTTDILQDGKNEKTADLLITKSSDRTIAGAGDKIVFQLDLVNYGPDNAENVVIYDTPPRQLSFVTSSLNKTEILPNSVYNPSSGNNDLAFKIPLLKKDESASFIMEFTVNSIENRKIVNEVRVVSKTTDKNASNNESKVQIAINAVMEGLVRTGSIGDIFMIVGGATLILFLLCFMFFEQVWWKK
jgi:uncharacterized repeat protein (TIGR01451 family)